MFEALASLAIGMMCLVGAGFGYSVYRNARPQDRSIYRYPQYSGKKAGKVKIDNIVFVFLLVFLGLLFIGGAALNFALASTVAWVSLLFRMVAYSIWAVAVLGGLLTAGAVSGAARRGRLTRRDRRVTDKSKHTR